MEVCVDNIQSAINASEGGATRIELCSSLSEGGLTPSLGVFQIIKQLIEIPIFVMLRPRNGFDFVYTKDEITSMKYDASIFKNAGANGFVFGILTKYGDIDQEACAEILEIIHPLPATFHRAFDCVANPLNSLQILMNLGFNRILTSGQKKFAKDGTELIKNLIEEAKGNIIIIPGSGIDENNISNILQETGASEIHGSFRTYLNCTFNVNLELLSNFQDSCNSMLITNTEKVKKIVSILKNWNNRSKDY